MILGGKIVLKPVTDGTADAVLQLAGQALPLLRHSHREVLQKADLCGNGQPVLPQQRVHRQKKKLGFFRGNSRNVQPVTADGAEQADGVPRSQCIHQVAVSAGVHMRKVQPAGEQNADFAHRVPIPHNHGFGRKYLPPGMHGLKHIQQLSVRHVAKQHARFEQAHIKRLFHGCFTLPLSVNDAIVIIADSACTSSRRKGEGKLWKGFALRMTNVCPMARRASGAPDGWWRSAWSSLEKSMQTII